MSVQFEYIPETWSATVNGKLVHFLEDGFMTAESLTATEREWCSNFVKRGEIEKYRQTK